MQPNRYDMVFRILAAIRRCLLALIAILIPFTPAGIVPMRHLVLFAIVLLIVGSAIILLARSRFADFITKLFESLARLFYIPTVIGVIAIIIPFFYLMLVGYVLWFIVFQTPFVCLIYAARAIWITLIYMMPDGIYARFFCDSRITTWVFRRIGHGGGTVSEADIRRFCHQAALFFGGDLETAPPLTEKVARVVARRTKRKIHVIRRLPAWWELFRYVLPEKIEKQVFDHNYNDLIADYLNATRHFNHPGRRKWLTFCFGLRTILMFLECLRAFALDRTVRSLAFLSPRRFIKSLLAD